MINRASLTRAKQVCEIRDSIPHIHLCDEYHLVVLIEAGFRPFLFRLGEYLWLLGLLAFGSSRAFSMSIGLNQLQYGQWLVYLELNHKDTGLFTVFTSCERLSAARAATKWYLNSRGFRKDSNQSVSKLYTGQRNHYYDGLFSESRKYLKKRSM